MSDLTALTEFTEYAKKLEQSGAPLAELATKVSAVFKEQQRQIEKNQAATVRDFRFGPP